MLKKRKKSKQTTRKRKVEAVRVDVIFLVIDQTMQLT